MDRSSMLSAKARSEAVRPALDEPPESIILGKIMRRGNVDKKDMSAAWTQAKQQRLDGRTQEVFEAFGLIGRGFDGGMQNMNCSEYAMKNARPDCSKCHGTGIYKYDDNHATVCDLCCQHGLGWWQLKEHYGEKNGKWCCSAGCGKTVDEMPVNT
jgi:hypothetical protein